MPRKNEKIEDFTKRGKAVSGHLCRFFERLDIDPEIAIVGMAYTTAALIRGIAAERNKDAHAGAAAVHTSLVKTRECLHQEQDARAKELAKPPVRRTG